MSDISETVFTPGEAASSFQCEDCGIQLIPFRSVDGTLIDAVRQLVFLCGPCSHTCPRELFYGTYSEYMQTDAWQRLRKMALERADHHCQVCNSDLLLQVHHRSYPTELGNERPADLTVLCRRCHDLFHNVRV